MTGLVSALVSAACADGAVGGSQGGETTGDHESSIGQVDGDRFSDEGTFRLGPGYGVPIHAALLPDGGGILLLGWEREARDPPCAGMDCDGALAKPVHVPRAMLHVIGGDPAGEVEVSDTALMMNSPPGYRDEIWCAGQTWLADGALMTFGGTRYEGASNYPLLGIEYTRRFDAGSRSWSAGPLMQGTPDAMSFAGDEVDFCAYTPQALDESSTQRWYPAATRLHDARVLVTGGYQAVYGKDFERLSARNMSVELFEADGASSEVVSRHRDTPQTLWSRDYTHVFQLPTPVEGGGDVLMFGEYGVPVLFDRYGDTPWRVIGPPRPDLEVLCGEVGPDGGAPVYDGPMHGATTLLLPLRLDDRAWGYHNGSVLTFGHYQSVSLDVFDPHEGAWIVSRPTESHRHHASSVILPDGRILIVNGHNVLDPATDRMEPSVHHAMYVDPRAGFAVAQGSAEVPEVRGYHSLALLLPDGRVLVGGGLGERQLRSKDVEWEQPTFRYYYPDYLRPGVRRPVISAAPAVIRNGEPFDLEHDASDAAEVVLMGIGAMTHAFDFNQRYVQLRRLGGALVEAAPSDRLAPPGPYMIFVVEAGIPSVARMVMVEPSA